MVSIASDFLSIFYFFIQCVQCFLDCWYSCIKNLFSSSSSSFNLGQELIRKKNHSISIFISLCKEKGKNFFPVLPIRNISSTNKNHFFNRDNRYSCHANLLFGVEPLLLFACQKNKQTNKNNLLEAIKSTIF